MSCVECGLNHSPIDSATGRCTTCKTLALAKAAPIGVPPASQNGAQAVDRISARGCVEAPRNEHVDGAELLDAVASFITNYMVLPSREVADLLALWTLHTWAFEAFWSTPYLRIVSATPGSGKSMLLEVLARVCRGGWHTVNPSVAVLYRKIDRDSPTLLLDEMDNYPLDDRRDALSVLNDGYRRGATVDRCKEGGELESFSCFCPKAYAGIDRRALPDTLLSRSITIRLEKRLPSEEVEMWIGPLVEPEAAALRERCDLWAEQNIDALSAHQPELLHMINREAEAWWPLLSIAELVGWQDQARATAQTLASGGDETDEQPEQVRLLLDIREAFADEHAIATTGLLAQLNGLDESPWGARRRGEGLDARGLARMLRPFKIKSRTVRIGEKTAKGYHVDQFEDAFARHLPEGSQGSQGSHRSPDAERDVTDVTDVTDIQPSGPDTLGVQS